MNRKQYNELKAKIEKLEKKLNGGTGSGNFGHSGRPGKVGGSSSDGAIEARAKAEAEYDKTHPEATQADVDEFRARVSKKDDTGVEKISDKRAYDHLRNNYIELGFDGSLVDTDFADDKAMTIFSSLESSDIMQLAEDKVKADDIYYSLEGNIYKFYKEGRDNASNLQSYMQKTNHSINEAINEVMSYGKTLAQASQLPEDTKKDFWLMDKDERSNPGNRARTLLDDVERRLLRHEFDSEGFTEFAKVSQQRIQALREVITHYDEINERVLDTPRSDKIIQDPSKKTNSFKVTRSTYDSLMSKIEKLEKQLNGGKGSGNFGHAGREGKVGGSAPSGSGGSVSSKNLRARLKGTDLEDFTDDELLRFYKARLADEKGVKERVMSMGASKETIDSLDKSIKAYEKDIATLEAEKAKSPSKVESTIDSIRPEVEKHEKELSKLSRKIYDIIDDTGEYIGSKQDALDYVKYNLVYGKDNVPKDEFELMSEAMIDDLEHISKIKTKKVRITELPMSDSGYVYREVKK